jgi:hypothetical protein
MNIFHLQEKMKGYKMKTPNLTRKHLMISAMIFIVNIFFTSAFAQNGELVPEWAENGKNELALFIGATFVESGTGLSLGLDYEYRFTRLFGLGATIEYTGSHNRDGVAAVSFDWHAWRELKAFIAAGSEINTEDGNVFLLRLGIEYGFDIGNGWEIAPALNFDVTSDEGAIVAGVGFGKSF